MNKELKKYFTQTKDFLSNKKVQNILVIVLFLSVLVFGAYIRIQSLPNLTDPTTGDYTPLDLDSYYFLRHSQTLLENNFQYPEVDTMRHNFLNTPYSSETMPHAVVILYKIIQIFDDSKTIMFANVISPLIFFLLGLIAFFFLVYVITKNKWIALVSSFVVSLVPTYLARTLVGSSDHDSFGMLGLFLVLLVFYYFLSKLQEKNHKNIYAILFGLISGFFAMFSISAWGGSGTYIFMIIPLTFLINWLINKKSNNLNNILFYASFILGTLFSTLLFGYDTFGLLKGYMLSPSSLFTFIALLFVIFEFSILKLKKINKKIKENAKVASLILTVILGTLFYQIFVGHVFEMILVFLKKVITPFGTARVALTVAENAQPYLNDLIGQLGMTVFYTFVLGVAIFGFKIAEGIKEKKFKNLFTVSYLFFIFGLLFTRISPTSVLNGDNFISKAILFISFLTILISSIYIYSKSDWEVDLKWIFLVILSIVMILSVRSAVRVFFVIVPFICFISILAFFEIFNYSKKSKDDLMKILSIVLLIFLIISLIITSFNFYKSDIYQSENSHPPYNQDWQNAMSWVRENTPVESVFLHWWDYGYWVQTGGKRATISDGGHPQEAFNGNHKVGRYVLTTPYPETAKSLMKTFNVTHLLIDPTDIGKYSAYSSIGDDLEVSDRASYIATFISDLSEVQETRNSTSRFYRGGMMLDDDLRYKDENQDVFLPKGNSGIGALVLEKTLNGYSQPRGIYVYNSKQYTLPIRFLFVNDELIDFGNGVNSTMFIYPNLINSQAGQKLDSEGAAMYLSEKTKDSLVVKLYLMNDPENEYKELELVHSESPYPFMFNYQGFRGPINIWEVHTEEMSNILIHEEFYNSSGEYGGLDNLIFKK
jgi:asparagine N-glycosylation enzyme membrane subunit Stt3